MVNTLLIIGCIVVFLVWAVVGGYAAYESIRDDRRRELKRKMEEKDELERKIRREVRDEIWLEEQSRKLRQEELERRVKTIEK